MNTYFERSRFTRLKPLAPIMEPDHQAAWCQLPDGRTYPVVDGVNGLVGGRARNGAFDGKAYVELMYGADGAGFLLTPAFPADPVEIRVKGEVVEIGTVRQPVVPWSVARECALLASPIPDGRVLGDVAGLAETHQNLALLEELYRELIAFPMPSKIETGKLALLAYGWDKIRGLK